MKNSFPAHQYINSSIYNGKQKISTMNNGSNMVCSDLFQLF